MHLSDEKWNSIINDMLYYLSKYDEKISTLSDNEIKKDIKLIARYKDINIPNIFIEVMFKFYNAVYAFDTTKHLIIQPTIIRINSLGEFAQGSSFSPIIIKYNTSKEELSECLNTIVRTVSESFKNNTDEDNLKVEWISSTSKYVKVNTNKYSIYNSSNSVKEKILNIKVRNELGKTIFKEYLKRKYKEVLVIFSKKEDPDTAINVISINSLFIDQFDCRIVAVSSIFTDEVIAVPNWLKELPETINDLATPFFDKSYEKLRLGYNDMHIKLVMFSEPKEVNLNEK